MKRIWKILLIGVMLMGLFGCTGAKYHVDYHGQKSLFHGAKDSYRAGQKVTLKYGPIATDTDYSFYVDGESVNADFDQKSYRYVITFTMPNHDIEVYCSSRNSMVYIEEPSTEAHVMTPVKVYYLKNQESDYTAPENQVSMHAEALGMQGKLVLTLRITNNTEESIYYGEDYSLQRLEDGEYVDVAPVEDFCWADIAYVLEPGESSEVNCNLIYYDNEDSFEAGSYRLIKSGLTADFTVAAEWTE